MSAPTTFDRPSAHRYFSAECFNTAWDFIRRPRCTAEEGPGMLHRSLVLPWR